ncbi:DUF917 domain-containing protein (plasmid) [Haloferax mediterranei ATCC 33500]|uniref:DUF917 domain-containing protein n=3 Tax=Halobacteriales TaxID=2235 RepID=I3R937_HALMT|nr:DUF917 domain-containing protein [Haloferax mediterranei]AFK20747.1 hypothetical protein HFX_4052 [Haloferax mediterranei ATCC 33500]AHZ24001.1 hypothetical protein BM92_19540 [Haloferax mediterranei ATCC 33500]ELZ97582.1 hypothetical protein C439_16738 [Haloferax mediterranei ATCC 33500]MDX5989675.1 DUF917 domain-containing protein [Haloferax mediterranei ATCC 33500]QCQ77424.1 DUF917 domain-containing protein [Haloferax mediterranei ATCC 33500]
MMVEIGVEEIEDIALGATILGTGGGGDPHVGKLVAKQAIEEFGPVELLDPDELDADDFVVPTAQMGAPTVSVEKLPSGREAVASLDRIERELGETADATMPIECGGINSTFPFAVAARRGLPVVDADGMGRAFPELQHETFNIYGVSGTPAAVSDERGNTCIIETDDNDQLEWLARGVTVRMGGVAYVSDYPMTGRQVKETAIPGTMSLARDLGRALRLAEDDAMDAIREVTRESIYGEARSLFEGKIVDVQRRTEHGFVFGHVDIDGLDGDEGSTMRIEFQNENLGAAVDGSYVATVPDLITVLDRETGGPIPTESLRYGARVRVLGIRTPEIMRTPAALDVWGPKSFGLEATYEPLADHP